MHGDLMVFNIEIKTAPGSKKEYHIEYTSKKGNFVQKYMAKLSPQNKIDQVLANDWNRITKDPKYRDLWYKLVKEYVGGFNNFKRWSVSSSASDKTDDGRH